MHNRRSIPGLGNSRAIPAFTLVELLVVFVIIAILVSSVLVASTHLIEKTRTRNTQSVLKVVQDAAEEFKRESPPIVKVRQSVAGGGFVHYSQRYGSYPPDELEVFTGSGLPGSNPANSYSLTPRGPSSSAKPGTRPSVVPAPTGGGYKKMLFYTAGNDKIELEHRDLAAMLLAISIYCPSATEMLGHLADSNWSDGAVDATGDPIQFLDTNGSDTWESGEDEQIRYIVDSWGMPISYFAQRDFDATVGATATSSSNHDDWNEASTEMIRLNGGQPIIMSFGGDGKDQLSKAALEETENSTAHIVADWMDKGDKDNTRKLNNVYNDDNVYADPSLKEKLARGAR